MVPFQVTMIPNFLLLREFPAWSWLIALLEFGGGILLVIGLFTRPVAFILAGEMAVAYWMFHAPQSPYPALNGGDAAILIELRLFGIHRRLFGLQRRLRRLLCPSCAAPVRISA